MKAPRSEPQAGVDAGLITARLVDDHRDEVRLWVRSAIRRGRGEEHAGRLLEPFIAAGYVANGDGYRLTDAGQALIAAMELDA